MHILLLDTETTSIGPDARLVQLGYKHLTTGECLNEYFKPPVAISYGSMAVHHITPEMVADKPVFDGSAQKAHLIELLKDSILVAHNALYDIGILANENVDVESYIDTLRVARHIVESEQYKLHYLRYFLHLNVEGQAHDAWGDVVVLEALFHYLKKAVQEKFNLDSEEKVIKKMFELTNLPVLLPGLRFGKYVGKTFDEVSQIDRGYLEWLYDSETKNDPSKQNEDLVFTLKHYLNI